MTDPVQIPVLAPWYFAHAWAELVVDATDKRPYPDDGTDALFTQGQVTENCQSALESLAQTGMQLAPRSHRATAGPR
ncbi:MAG TPA: hypothetical protein VG122_24355 [Gemmata sp.]|nr:hypothetical protein [Gemmata sp.]